MPPLPVVLRGLSRRTTAVILGIVLVAAGGMAGYAATGGFAPSDTTASGAADAASSGATISPTAVAETGQPQSAEPAASPSPTPAAEDDVVTIDEAWLRAGGAGGNHSINVHNEEDGRLHIKGSIQLNTITAPNIAPRNSARAWSSCVDCQTLALAMQINLIDRNARRVVPQNAAIAINYQCSGCVTVAIALQYTFSVDNPRETPREVQALVRAMDRELRRAAQESVDLADAVARIDRVLGGFAGLVAALDDERDEATEETSPGAVDETPPPSTTPTPSATGEASASPTAQESPVPSPTATPTATPSDAASAPP